MGSLLNTKNMRKYGSKRLGWSKLNEATFESTMCSISLEIDGTIACFKTFIIIKMLAHLKVSISPMCGLFCKLGYLMKHLHCELLQHSHNKSKHLRQNSAHLILVG